MFKIVSSCTTSAHLLQESVLLFNKAKHQSSALKAWVSDMYSRWKDVTCVSDLRSQRHQYYQLISVSDEVAISMLTTPDTTIWPLHPSQVRSIAVSHTFKIEKAQRELGFIPKKYSLTDSVDQYLRSRPARSATSFPNSQHLFLLLLLLLIGFITLMFCSAAWE